MIISLYILFAISVLAPIYTYAVYPIILKLLPARKKYSVDEEFMPSASIILKKSSDEYAVNKKLLNLNNQNYPSDKYEIIPVSINAGISEYNKVINAAKGDIIVISDSETIYDCNAVRNLTKHFSDNRIGCVIGQLRKKDETGKEIESGIFWKYENFVRKQESKLGVVSGANHAIYAFRKKIITAVPQHIIDIDFFISTYILQAGYDAIMETEAVAYESLDDNEKQQFERHVRDGMGYYQALGVFWRLLLPRKGAFVYVSHRVMKWLVPLNLIVAFLTSTILSHINWVFAVLLGCQAALYFALILYHLKFVKTQLKIFELMRYFMDINLAYLIGCLRLLGGVIRRKD